MSNISTVTPTESQIAFAAGYNASSTNKSRVPAQCTVYRQLIAGAKIGEKASELADAWLSGYATKCDEDAAAILAS